MDDIFTGYIRLDGRHVVDGLKEPLNAGWRGEGLGAEYHTLISDKNPDWKKRRFYESAWCEVA